MKFKRSIALAMVLSVVSAQLSFADSIKYASNVTALSVVDESVASGSAADVKSYESSEVFTEGKGTVAEPYKVATAEQLNAVRNDLAAHYVLTADIDLSAYENWEPIGAFVPVGTEGEAAETPTAEYAFTGSLDGNGHTISNLKIADPKGFCKGIFGCVYQGEVKNIVLTDVNVCASMMVGGAVGFLSNSTADNIRLEGDANVIEGTNKSDYGYGDMVGGVVGAAMDSVIKNCYAKATVNLDDGVSNAGILSGGDEVCTVTDCTTEGTINAGENSMGLGGLIGCNFSGDKIENCVANTAINAGSNAYLVGGVVGYAGGFDGVVTNVKACDATVKMELGENASRVGGIIGGGFFNEQYVSFMPNPASYKADECTAEGTINAPNGEYLGEVAGYTFLSELNNSTGEVVINGTSGSVMGDEVNYEFLSQLAGTYQTFFENGVALPKFDKIWHDYCSAIVGESNADATAEYIKSACMGTLYGEEAVKAYSDGSRNIRFFCGFTEGVSNITVDGSYITGTDADGNVVFSHPYYYVDRVDSKDWPGFSFNVYKTNEDAGEFTYFAFCDDTPDTTYHIEFRYGSDLDSVTTLLSGKYAYWLAAGALTSTIDGTDLRAERVIALYTLENMDYTAERNAESLSQLSDLEGRWNADMSAFAGIEAYKNADLYMVISADGTGKSYVDMTGNSEYIEASSFKVYTYDNDGSESKKSGIYAVYTDDEGSKSSHYAITKSGNKETVDFYDIDGAKLISYYRIIEDADSSDDTDDDGVKSTRRFGGGKASSKASVLSNAADKKNSR